MEDPKPKQLPEYIIRARNSDDLDSLLAEFENWNVKPTHRYHHVFCGAAVRISNLLVKWYKNDPRVIDFEKCQEIDLFARQSNGPGNNQINHLDRIDQRNLPLSQTFTYSRDGQGVICYVLDSGGTFRGKNKLGNVVGFDHVEFEGRLSPVPDPADISQAFDPFFDNETDDFTLNHPRGYDLYGHGTHVAGIVGSKTYGVAKKSTIKTVKVFSRTGRTTNSVILAGIDAIIADHNNQGQPTAVCNMSFGGSVSAGSSPTSLEIAVQAMIDQGIFCVAAAGNAGRDASTVSPARMSTVMTVGASQAVDDGLAAFSNFGDAEDVISPGGEFGIDDSQLTNSGSVVNIFAPGVGVISTYNTSATSVLALSGTSMASPVVAGVAALHIQNDPGLTPSQIFDDIISTSTPNVLDLSGALPDTPNLLVFSNFIDQTIEWNTPSGLLVSVNEGLSINIRLSASGFSGNPIIYQIVSGTLPMGVNLDGNSGFLQGIAPEVSVDTSYNFTVRAYDGSVFSSIYTDRSFTIEVKDGNLPPVWNTFPNLGSVTEGDPIQIQLTASSRNGVSSNSLIYSPVSALPPGVTCSSAGLLTGIAPHTIGNDVQYRFVLKVDDGISSANREFTLLVKERNDRPVMPNQDPDWITPAGQIAQVVAGDSFSFFLQAQDPDNLPQPLEYFLERAIDGSQVGPFGSMPPGLTLDELTGEISGTVGPLTSDREYVFAVYVTDGANFVSRLFSIQSYLEAPNQPPVWVTPSGSLGQFSAGENITITLEALDADGGPNPVTYSVSSGQLPPGLTLDSNSGLLSGSPALVSKDTVYQFIVSASDGELSETRSFQIQISKVNQSPIWITDNDIIISDPGDIVRTGIARINEGSFLSLVLQASDPLGDKLNYSVVSGTLPPNVVLNNNGLLSGGIEQVNANTQYEFTVRVDDSVSNAPGETLFADRIFRIEVVDGELNPNQPPVWQTPAGYLEGTVDPGTGKNSGYAYEGEPYLYPLLALNPEDLPADQSTIRYTLVSGSLPLGLTLNFSTGFISGTPLFDDNFDDEEFEFTVRASDGILFTDRNFILKFIDQGNPNQLPIWITPSDLGTWAENDIIAINLMAEDPDGGPILYSLLPGSSLPAGISLTVGGLLTGQASNISSTTTFDIPVRAIDEQGGETVRIFQLQIEKLPNEAPVWITGSDLGSFDEGDFFNTTLQATDPDGSPLPITYLLVNGSLPLGLILDPLTGEISGALPFVESTTVYSFGVSATDGISSTVQTFVITVNNVLEYTGDYIELSVPILGNLRNDFRKWNDFSLISNSDLFLPGDARFGRVTEPKIYIASRIRNTTPDFVFENLDNHHLRFDSIIGGLKSATARDGGGNALYDIIYLEIKDPQLGSDFDIQSGPLESSQDTNGIEKFVSQNFQHLREHILETFVNDDSLPLWMVSEQDPGDADSVIGYKPCVEVAYVLPGRGSQIVEQLISIELQNVSAPSEETRFDIDPVTGNPTTIFDNNSTTFDKEDISRTEIAKGPGLLLTGRVFTADRYLWEKTTQAGSEIQYLPWTQSSSWPHWITPPGLLAEIFNGSSVNIQLQSSVPVSDSEIYHLIFGSLPPGTTLDPISGYIIGTVNYTFDDSDENVKHFNFGIRINNDDGKCSDSAFQIKVNRA